MTREELQETINYLEAQFLRIRTTKTNLLEIQSTLTNEEEYTANEEDFDRLFDALDENLNESKRNLRKIIDNLNNN